MLNTSLPHNFPKASEVYGKISDDGVHKAVFKNAGGNLEYAFWMEEEEDVFVINQAIFRNVDPQDICKKYLV